MLVRTPGGVRHSGARSHRLAKAFPVAHAFSVRSSWRTLSACVSSGARFQRANAAPQPCNNPLPPSDPDAEDMRPVVTPPGFARLEACATERRAPPGGERYQEVGATRLTGVWDVPDEPGIDP